jgi:hypothetical protein
VVVPEGGSVVGLFRTLNVYVCLRARYSALRTVFQYTLVPALNVAGHRLGILIASHNDPFVDEFQCVGEEGTPYF